MATNTGGYRSQLPLLLSLVLVALPLAGSAAPHTAAARAGHVHHVGHAAAGHLAELQGASAAAPAGAEAALRLQALLGHHSIVAADMMRGRIRGDEDFAQAANAALGRNTGDMAELVRSLFGTEAADRFAALWGDHVVALLNYAGQAGQDNAERDRARRSFTDFERELALFFSGASQGRLSPQAAQEAVLAHVDQLLDQADAYAARDRPRADRLYRAAYEHTYHMGESLAAALLPPEQSAALKSATWRLRSALGKLLAEHVVLMVDVTRAGLLNNGDLPTAIQAVNGNTEDLAAAVDSLFGAPAATAFQSMWSDHIDALGEYVAGSAAQDTARRDRARGQLDGFEDRFAAFLETATGKRLDARTLAQALLNHDQMLVRHADSFAAKDYPKAYELADTAFKHMFDLAGQLADAFGATVAARLPVGGAQTGGGGTAAVVGRR
jgi:hypothetical protein